VTARCLDRRRWRSEALRPAKGTGLDRAANRLELPARELLPNPDQHRAELAEGALKVLASCLRVREVSLPRGLFESRSGLASRLGSQVPQRVLHRARPVFDRLEFAVSQGGGDRGQRSRTGRQKLSYQLAIGAMARAFPLSGL
jgi:hypothetical protein